MPPGPIGIAPATLTVTSANASRAYGTSDPGFTYSYSGFVLGQTLGTSGVSGAPTQSSTDTSASPVGRYSIITSLGTLAAQNYTFALVNGTLSITPAALTVTAANVSRVYGAADPAFTAIYSGFVLGQTLGNSGVTGAASLTGTDTSSSPVGSYTINVGLGTLGAQSYAITLVNAASSVTPALLTVTANSGSRTYGAANPAFTASYSGFVLGQTLGNSGVTGAPGFTTPPPASARWATTWLTRDRGRWVRQNYTFTFSSGTLTVTPATLTVSAANASRSYGAADPAFTASYSGFVLGQTLATSGVSGSPTFTSTDSSASPAGSYTITVALGTLGAQNYTFAGFSNGTLSVVPATLTVTAGNASRAYGAADPAYSAGYSGFVLGQTLGNSGVTGSPSFTSTDSSASPVGSYLIWPVLGSLAAQNYTFAMASGTLSVTPVALTVTANNATRIYGAADPAFAASYAGFVLGQTAGNSGISGAPSFTSTDGSSSPLGTYAITPALGTLSAQNYTFTSFVNGTLHVTPATLIVTATNATRTYAAADPAFSVGYSGFVLAQTLGNSGVSGAPSFTSTDGSTSPVVQYSIMPALGSLGGAKLHVHFRQRNAQRYAGHADGGGRQCQPQLRGRRPDLHGQLQRIRARADLGQ